MNRTLYAVTTFFNPQAYKSRLRLYRNFARHMYESGVVLLTIEAAFGDREFEATASDNPWHIQIRTDQLLWHKERMINVALPRLFSLAPDARFVGWFDADITFTHGDWAAQAVHKLQHTPVIQPFAEAINLDANEQMMWKCPSSFNSFLTGRGFHQEPPLPLGYFFKGHPGLAWCATKEALVSLGGLYDTCVAGSGDTVMSNGLKGGWDVYLPSSPSPAMCLSMERWAKRCDLYVRGRVGYTPGTVFHHWHGRSESRGYEKRWSILSFHRFDETTDLITDPANGLYRWAGNKPRLEDDMRLSLGARAEDDG